MAVAAALALVLVLRGEAPPRAFDNPMLERATSAERVGHTLGNRLRNWEAGMKAFAERPVLGWGSDNYFIASVRHLLRAGPPRQGARPRAQPVRGGGGEPGRRWASPPGSRCGG